MFARALLVEQYISFTHFCVPSYGDSQIKSWHRELPLKKKKNRKKKGLLVCLFCKFVLTGALKAIFSGCGPTFSQGRD